MIRRGSLILFAAVSGLLAASTPVGADDKDPDSRCIEIRWWRSLGPCQPPKPPGQNSYQMNTIGIECEPTGPSGCGVSTED